MIWLNSDDREFLTGRLSLVPGPANLAAPVALIDVVIKTPQWMDDAICAQTAPDVFFPDKDRGARWEAEEAKAICARCPVRAACLDFAEEHGEEYGVWGGLSVNERRVRARARQAQARGSAA